MIARLVVPFALLLFVAACASSTMSPSGPGATRDSDVGEVYVDADGMTLYTYDLDQAGVSNCTGFCAEAWPPVLADSADQNSGRFTVISRPNGFAQWALDGMPLYTYAFDSGPGDASGDGVDDVWRAARP